MVPWSRLLLISSFKAGCGGSLTGTNPPTSSTAGQAAASRPSDAEPLSSAQLVTLRRSFNTPSSEQLFTPRDVMAFQYFDMF